MSWKKTFLSAADRACRYAEKIEKWGLHLKTAKLEDFKKLESSEEIQNLTHSSDLFRLLLLDKPTAPESIDFLYACPASEAAMQAAYAQAIACLKSNAEKIECGALKPDDYSPEIPLLERWNALATLSRRLETIVQKQLAAIDLSEAELTVLLEVGEHIAHTLGFNGDAMYFQPLRDDTPRWAEVAHDARPGQDRSLGTGIGRARVFHVLYPWHGEEIFCTGAVLPYYEEWSPTKRLTDEEWKQKLDSPAAPRPPDWIAPILAR